MPRNPTPAQIEASRRNGAKSKGPKHQPILDSLPLGLTASATCLPSEDQETFQQVLQSFLLHYQPQNDMEATCVEEMANATWRIRRLWIHEQHLITHHAEPGPPTTLQEALSQQKQLPALHRHWQQESRLRAAHQQSLTRLAALRRGLVPPPTNIPSEPEDSTLCNGLTHSIHSHTPQLTGPENPSNPSHVAATGPFSTSPVSTPPSSTPLTPIPLLSGPFAMLSAAWKMKSIALRAAALFLAFLLVPLLSHALEGPARIQPGLRSRSLHSASSPSLPTRPIAGAPRPRPATSRKRKFASLPPFDAFGIARSAAPGMASPTPRHCAGATECRQFPRERVRGPGQLDAAVAKAGLTRHDQRLGQCRHGERTELGAAASPPQIPAGRRELRHQKAAERPLPAALALARSDHACLAGASLAGRADRRWRRNTEKANAPWRQNRPSVAG